MQPAPNSAKSGTDVRSINWRHFILGFALLLMGFALITFVWMTIKIHSHIYYKQENGTFKYFNVLNNMTAVELLTSAQKHDMEGHPDLGTIDYKYAMHQPDFKKLNNKVKVVLKELLDCRRIMEKDDYFGELVSHSNICYWRAEQMPIRIYIPENSKKDGFNDFDRRLIKRCFDEWCSIVPGRLSYKVVNNPAAADISFAQKDRLIDLSFSRSVLAHTIPIPSGPSEWSVFPVLKTKIEPLRFNPEITSESDKRVANRHMILLHEIGHALGIVGHSCNAGDLMYFSGAPVLSERDRATFRKIYAPGSVYERAEAALRKLAAQKDEYAMMQIANQLDEHGTASNESLKQVFDMTKAAAEQGSAKAMLALGWMYHDGSGVKRDLKRSVYYYHMASKKGSMASMLALAAAYERGDGEKQDLIKAEKYLQLSMQLDLLRAPIAYGNFLSYQYGFPESLERAANLYKKNASNEQAEGQMRLATLYEQGQGIAQNLDEAKKLREQARKQMAKISASNAPEYFSRGCGWADVDEPEKAIADYTKALQQKKFKAGYIARASAEQTVGKCAEACADLTEALKLDPDCVQAFLGRSYSYLGLEKYKESAADAESVIANTSEPDSDRVYADIVGSIAYRFLKNESAARTLLEQAKKQTTAHAWPGPIVRYLSHDLSAKDFQEEARGYSRSTEVYFYMAMDELQNGKSQDAIKHLKWIEKNGDRSFYEHPVALAFLRRKKVD